MIYIIILLYFIVVAYNLDYKKSKFDKTIYIIEWLTITLLFGLRYRVGGDSLGYEDEFNNLPSLSEYLFYGTDFYPYQPFWYILNGILKSIWNNFVFFQIVHCAFINTVFLTVFKKCSRMPYTCVLFYFFFFCPYFSTEIIRESIAAAFFALSCKYLFDQKYIKYYLFVFVAFMFHASAGILFIIPLLVRLFKRFKNKEVYLVITVSVLLMLSAGVIISYASKFTMLNEASMAKIMRYYGLTATVNINGMIKPLLDFSACYLLYSLLKKNKVDYNLICMVSIYMLFTLCRLAYDTISYRFANYIAVFFYMAVVSLLYNKKQKNVIIRNEVRSGDNRRWGG